MQKPIFKVIQKAIVNSPDIKCLVIPFFENGYKMVHEKMVFVCANEMSQLFDLIHFKNSFSRIIENFQYIMSSDRYSSYNGLLRKQSKFITFVDDKPEPVIARLYGKNIILISNDAAARFIKDFSLYQLRKSGAFIVSKLIKAGKINETWNSKFDVKPSEDCCIGLRGELDQLYLCAVSNANEKKLRDFSRCL